MKQGFRELESTELWSAHVTTSLDKRQVADLLQQVATQEEFTFFGFFILQEMRNYSPTEYHFTRYPRRKYGIPSIEQCNEILEKLTTTLHRHDSRVMTKIDVLSYLYEYRVVLGLLEGYEQQHVTHSVEEVQDTLGLAVNVQEVTIHTVGPHQTYTESAAIIRVKKPTLSQVYILADEYKQERFTVEDFSNRTAYVVETRHAKEPDAT